MISVTTAFLETALRDLNGSGTILTVETEKKIVGT
jgi:hypothetical protein